MSQNRKLNPNEQGLLKKVREKLGEVPEASLCLVLLGDTEKFLGGITATEESLIRNYADELEVTLPI